MQSLYPMSLHGFKLKKNTKQGAANDTPDQDSTKEIINRAILDSCREILSLVEDLVNALEIDGVETSVMVKTLNEQSWLKSKLVNGLALSNPSSKNFSINLPCCYTRKELSIDPEEIPAPKKLRRWQYLQTIASETVQNPSVHADILIRANCLPALETMELIGSKADGPMLIKQNLVCVLWGPLVEKIVLKKQ